MVKNEKTVATLQVETAVDDDGRQGGSQAQWQISLGSLDLGGGLLQLFGLMVDWGPR